MRQSARTCKKREFCTSCRDAGIRARLAGKTGMVGRYGQVVMTSSILDSIIATLIIHTFLSSF